MKSQTYSIQELMTYLSSRETRLDSTSSRKKYITLCNSLSIKLLQSHLHQNALEVCLKGISASKILIHANIPDKL